MIGRHWRVSVCWALVLAFVWLALNETLPARTVYLAAVVVTVALIINLLAASESLPARAVACPPLRSIGRISYSLYLYHLLVRNVVYHYQPRQSVYVSAVITFAVSILLAALSWWLFKSRVLRLQRPRQQRSVGRVQGGRRLAAEAAR